MTSIEERADVIIVGAGCAGLSLACALAERSPKTAVTLLEPRLRYEADRTWCFWRGSGEGAEKTRARPYAFERSIAHRWTRWRVRAEGQEVVRGSERYTYCHVPAERFYDDACLRLAASPQISLRLGTRVSSIVDAGTHVRAETAGGAFIGRVAVDTRPRAPDADARLTSLVQHFRGWFVRAAGPVFDPTVVTLMDFDVSQCHGLHFMYVLPFSAEDALVESTYFSAAALAPEAYDEAIARYLSDVYGLRRGAFDVTGAESGAIPMSNALGAGPRGGRIVRAGVAAGAAKPSTGYAFAAIQRASAALADSLLAEPPAPPPSFRSTWTAALDEVFLSWLARAPDDAPRMFRTLFERLPADVAVRFLSGESSLAEDLQAMAASPKRAMTAEAVRALVRYLATGGAR